MRNTKLLTLFWSQFFRCRIRLISLFFSMKYIENDNSLFIIKESGPETKELFKISIVKAHPDCNRLRNVQTFP